MNKLTINLLSIAIVLTLAGGCVHTTFETKDGISFNRWAVLYPAKTGVQFNPDTGMIDVNYNSDGGENNLKTGVELGYKIGTQAAKAAL